eukprot:Platyproteum_vivax@DN5725_c0_g1_i2.p1
MVKVIVGYWGMRGLGATARMMCEYGGAECEQRDHGGDWFDTAKPPLLEKNPLVNLPYIIIGDQIVGQSSAVYNRLGREFNLLGSTEEEISRNEQVAAVVLSSQADTYKLLYRVDRATWDAKKDDHYNKEIPDMYKLLEAVLEQKPHTYFARATPSTSDFIAWPLLDQHELQAKKLGKPSPLANFPKLKALHQALLDEPKLKAFFPKHYKYQMNASKAPVNDSPRG